MASHQGGSGPGADDVVVPGPESSYLGSSEPEQGATAVCSWRTTVFHDQECSHFFDCPTHQVERRLSTDDTDGIQAVPRGVSGPDLTEEGNPDATPPPVDEAQNPSAEDTVRPPSPADSSTTPPVSRDTHLEPDVVIAPAEPAAPEAPEVPEAPPAHTVPEVERADRPEILRELPALPLESPGWSSEPDRTASASAPPEQSRREVGDMSAQGREDSFPPSPADELSPPNTSRLMPQSRRPSDIVLPRWQPDAEVTYCPICHSQFNIFVRKHHCRKCGRVVCNSCSPHRIIIPHQYIVRPPGSDIPLPQSLLIDGLGGGYFDVNGLSGGERVRLCNPCVPDPNTAPPHSPATSQATSPRSSHHRSRSSLGNAYTPVPHANRYSAVITPGQSSEFYHYYAPRTRSITMVGGPSRHTGGDAYHATFDRILAGAASSSSASTSYPARVSSLGGEPSSSRQRVLPPTPQIAEEDECPICHRELPPRSLPNFESVREAHITQCIQSHSAYGSPRRGDDGNAPLAAPRRTGMYAYPATEKDCIDDAECTICLEEFTVGVRMARLECLCRFHYSCISAWFVNHPGRCPVHQHDGFGY